MYQYKSDVLIHIDEDLDDGHIHELERDLGQLEGVYSACVSEKARHLLLVDYDPQGLDSIELLYQVEDHGLHAELIGL